MLITYFEFVFLIHIYFIVRYGDSVRQFKIQLIDGKYFVVRRTTFGTPNELVQ